MTTQELKALAETELDKCYPRLQTLSRKLHDNPETGFNEEKASAWLVEELQKVSGAEVIHGLGELPTAVRADVGSGPLTITICAEYDALPGVGHACGHNIIAASALGAFTALAPLADALDISVRLLGTPAEESGGCKITMLEQGDFDGTHAAMMIHPGDVDEVSIRPFACSGYDVRFTGRSAHASAQPQEGINALDALTVAMTAIGLARQQFEPGQQIHGYVDHAGTAPNVIPESASGQWMVRAMDVDSLERLTDVLRRCMEAGALATGATVELAQQGGVYAEMRSDAAMDAYFLENARSLGRAMSPIGRLGGSTDMANVSHHYPTIHPLLGLGPGCPPIHSPEFAENSISPAGDKAIWDGALGMVWTAIDLATDPEQRARLLSFPAAENRPAD